MKKRITKVTTKTGDDGSTGMADGTRLRKSDPIIHCIGEIDELNSLIGYLAAANDSEKHKGSLIRIQNCLFNIGGSLSLGSDDSIKEGDISFIEEEINLLNADLPNLENFILPGGHSTSALAQLVRSVCRRCERSLVSLSEKREIEERKIIYINRLSDLFFVMARSINKEKNYQEVLWQQT
ncbi:MAG: cob(I)yrinic acid a,c-diamide adenosyltransferase [SAR86 cluster bacterium]|nr:cob(I)yrinic acid a,c-diamide adenosyltransferase [SAR86 cluster bacterium]